MYHLFFFLNRDLCGRREVQVSFSDKKINQSHYRPEVSRKLRFPVYVTTAQNSGNVVSLTHRPVYPKEILLVLILLEAQSPPCP